MANERERVASVDLAMRLVLFLLACGCASLEDVLRAASTVGSSGEAAAGWTSPPAWRRRRGSATVPRACAPSAGRRKPCRTSQRHCRRESAPH